jgi:DNA invertase Pin-like site-specific DNA recombinase
MKKFGKKAIRYCYGYCRVSTTKQSKDGTSIQSQENIIREWAESESCEILAIKCDEGISGTLPYSQRPGIAHIMKYIRKGDILVVANFSRLGRNFNEAINITEKLSEIEAYFISIDEGYDTTESTGKLTMQILASVAEHQALQISRYAKEAYKTFKELDRHYGSVPYGYVKISDQPGSGLEEVPEEQNVIILIREMRRFVKDNGNPTSFNDIADYLNERGIPSPRDKKWRVGTIQAIHERTHVAMKGRANYDK